MGMASIPAAAGKAVYKAGKKKSKIKKPGGYKNVPKMGGKGAVKPTKKTSKATKAPKAPVLPTAKPAVTMPGNIGPQDIAKNMGLDRFKKENPNAPKLPPGTGIEGSPSTVAEQAEASGGIQPQQHPLVDAAQVTMQDKFKQRNPNAPKMPGDIAVQGAPANRPQQPPKIFDKGGRTPSPRIPRPGGQSPGEIRRSTGSWSKRPGGSRPSGKGGQHPAKGGQRPSPRPNPYAGGGNPGGPPKIESLSTANPYAGMQPGGASDAAIQSATELDTAPMMKKAPAFKMRSPHSTTFKEMGSSSDNKKSAPTRKTGGGYKMPGYGKR